ncbi:MAG: hypothetical protein PHS79_04780 [Patescibacteria group bacterium]|nr:hypothetical protein [Patescibacteria group bacterium]
MIPRADNTYDLGSTTNKWRNLFTAFVSTTNLLATGYVSTTELYINGTLVTGTGTQDLQDVTDLGAITTNWIQFAGATSTSNFLPGTNNLYNLGSTAYAWKKLFSTNVSSTNIDASGYVSSTNMYAAMFTGNLTGDVTGNVSGQAGYVANSLTNGTGIAFLNFNGSAATSVALTNTGVSAGYYGTTLQIPNLLIDAQGRIVAASTTNLGTMALQDSNNVSITGGTISGLTYLSVTNVSSTNIDALGYVSTTQLYINGTLVTGTGTQNLQDVTDLGAITTNWIQFAGATSTADFRPSATDSYSLGTSAYRWKNLFASTGVYSSSTIQTLNLTVYGNVASSLTPSANNTFDLGSITNSWKNIYASSTAYLMGDVYTRNVTTTGILYTGATRLTTDAGGPLVLIDEPLSATPAAGTRQGYIFSVGSNRFLDMYAQSTGAANGIQNASVRFYQTLRPDQNNTTDIGAFDGAVKSLYVSSTSYLAALDVGGHVIPRADNTYDLGSTTNKWRNLFTTFVSTTNLLATGYVSTTALYVNGTQITGSGSQNLQEVTDIGYVTTNPIQVAGVSSTADILPTVTDSYGLGTSSIRWKNLFASTGVYSSSTVQTLNLTVWGNVASNLIPSVNNTYSLGSASKAWTNIYASSTSYLAALDVGGHVIPRANNTYDLGSTTNKWRNLFTTFVSTTNLLATGYVSTTALYINGTLITGTGAQDLQDVTDLGAITTNWIQFAGATSTSNFLPGTNNLYNLGSTAYAWKKLFSTNVSSTNIDASGYISTAVLYVNGTQVTGIEAQDLQDVTDLGAITTNWIQFAGATSTADFRPSATDSYSLGTSAYRWKNLFASTGVYSSSTIQTLNLTVYGNVASDLTPSANNTYSLGTAALSWKNIYASSTAYLMGDVYTRNVTTTGILYTGATRLTTDAGGPLVLIDESLSATPAAGTQQGYIFSVGSNYFLNMYAESAGAADTVQNASVRFYQTLRPDQNNSTDIGAFDGAVKSLYVSSTSYLAALDVGGHVIPRADNTYDLGSSTNHWRNLFAVSVSTTDLLATGYVSTTALYINGTQLTVGGETQNLQDVTDLGAITTNWIQFAGATSTADFRPSATDSYSLGTSAYRWKNLFASTGVYSSSTIQTLNLTVYGNVASDLTPSANNTYSLGTAALSWKNIYASSTAYLMGDVYTRNVTTTGILYTGATRLNTDTGGPFVYVDEPLSATPAAGTRQGYIFAVGSNYFLDMYAQSTGAANGIQNASVRFYQTLRPDQNNSTDIGAFDGAVKSLYVSSTSYLAALDVGGHVIPRADNTYDLGSTTNKWRNLFTTFVSTTNLLATGYVSTTALYVNGTAVTGGGGGDLQVTTDLGYVTDNPIQTAGVSTTGNILPVTSLSYDLGSSSNRWKDVWASSTRVGTSTWDIWQSNQGFTISNNDLANKYFTINNNGYVGVGTAYPSSLLSIAGGATNDASTNYGDEKTVEIGGYINTPYLYMGQYQNFLLQTETFDNASWLKSNLSGAVAANGWYSPEDTKIAEGIPAGNAADSHIKQNITNATTGNWTFSVWLKAQSGTAPVSLRIDSNTETGTAKQVVLTTQWQRYSVTQNLSAAHATSGVFIINGTNAIAAWGAQLEPVAAPRVYSGPLTTVAITTLTKYTKFRSNLSSYGSITSSAGIAAGGAISGATTIATTNYITQTIPTLYVSTEGHVMTAAVSTGVTAALVPLSLSPRIRQIGQAWDIDGAANTLNSYWQEVIPYPGNTVNSKLSWYRAQGAMATTNEYQAPEIMNYYNGSLNVLGSTYGSNILRDGTFASGATYWTAGTGWTLAGTTATYTYNATPNGTLSQSSADFTAPVKPNRWYRFTYSTLNQNTTVNVYIDPAGISQERVYLRSVNIATPGTWTTTFKTNSNPGDFILTGYGAAASDKCDFQNVSLVEVQSGDVVANGLFTGGGMDGIKIDQNGNVGIGTTSTAIFKLQVAGNVGPSSTNAYDLGSSTYKWRNLFTTYASTTNLLATGYVSTTALYINGTQFTGVGITGSGTDERIMRWNGTDAAQDSLVTIDNNGNLYPYVNNEASLGTASNSWNSIYASSTIFSGAATGVNFRFTTSGFFESNNTSGASFAFYPKQTTANGSLFFVGDKDLNQALFIKNATHTSIGAEWNQDFALNIGGSIGPSTSNSYNLGSASKSWKDVYASGTIRGDQLLAGYGSYSAPGFSFKNDPDTGMYNNGGNSLYFAVNGVDQAYLASQTLYIYGDAGNSGALSLFSTLGDNVTIHAHPTSAQYSLVLPDALPGSTQFLVSDTSGNLSWSAGSGTGITGSGTDNRIMRWNGTGAAQDSLVTIDDTGKVGVGDTSPLALLTVGASDAFQVSSAGNVFVPNGAFNAPSYSFVSNPDTGIYLTGSTIAFTLDSSISTVLEAGNITVYSPSISSGASIHLSDNSESGFLVGIRAPVTLSNEYELILPTNLPGSTQFLVSDTSGNLSWSAGSGAGITGSGVDNHIMRWNGTGAAQSSNTIIDDTGNVMPSSTLTMDLGSSSYRWKDLWVSSTYIGDSTWNLREAGTSFVIADKSGGDNEIFRIYSGANGSARLQGIDSDLNIKTTQDSSAQVSFSNTSGVMGYAGFSGNDFTIMNNAVSNGLYFGTNATSKVVLYTNYFAPVANNTYELGDTTHKWKNLFVGNVSSTSLLANGPIVQTASTPTRVASITMNDSSYSAMDVQIDGDRVAYIDRVTASSAGYVYIGQLRQQTITNKATISVNGARSVKLIGNLLYINDGSNLYIYDITNLGSPALLGLVQYDVTINDSWIDVAGRYAYIGGTGDSKLHKIDISDPRKPVLIHTKNISGIYGVKASYPYVYLTRNGVGVSILDVSNPSTTTLLGTYALATAAASDVEGSTLFALGTNGNLYAVDISVPGTVVQYASKAIGRTPGLPSKLIARNGLIYILENNNSFSIWRLNGSTFDRVYVATDSTYLRNGLAMDIKGNTMAVFAGDGSTHYISTYDLHGTSLDSLAVGTADVSRLSVTGLASFKSSVYVEGDGLFDGGVHANGPSAFTANISTLGSQSLTNGYFTVDNENVSFIDSRSVYGSIADTTSVKVNLFAMATGTDLTTGDTQLGATYNIVASMPYTLNNVAGGDSTPNVNIYGYMSNLGSNPRKIYTLANLSIYNGVNGLFYNEDGTAANALLARSNDVNNATAHFINSASSTSATTLYINQGGSNTIGTRILQVWNAVDGTPKMSVRGNGAVYADTGYNAGGGDYAEWMRHNNLALLPGEVVVLDLANATSVARSTYVNRNKTVGIVSSNPSVVGNTPGGDSDYEIKPTEWAMVGMLGQLTVKFSDIYGVVNTGDKLMAGDDGYAVKAKGSGMVLGEALTSASASGTVMVYLHPHWWAGDLLAADGSVNLVTSDLAMQAKGTADETTQGYDSHAFSFNGSGWDQNASSSVATSFQINNHTVNSTSSGLEFSFATGTNSGNLSTATSVFSISNQGNVTATGDLTVGKRLFLGSKTTGFGSSSTYIFVDDTLAPTSTYIATNADGWMTSSTYDYAERYESKEDLQPGDLVTVDPTGVNLVKRSTSPNEPILGIVSTRPGFVTGGYMKGNFPIALAGRVPTRVSIVNGVIQVGDYLTASTVPGVAVKAIGPGNVVGVALESYSGAQEGLISVFVKPSYTAGSIGESGTPSTVVNNYSTPTTDQQTEIEGLALITAGAKQVHISYDSVLAYPMVYATPNASLDGGSWWIDNRTDTGFDIVISAAQSHDIEFSWLVRTMLPGTIRFVSDNTHYPVDNLTGQMVGPQKPTDEQSTSTPATLPDSSPTSTPVIPPTSTPDTTPTSTPATPPPAEDVSSSTSTTTPP